MRGCGGIPGLRGNRAKIKVAYALGARAKQSENSGSGTQIVTLSPVRSGPHRSGRREQITIDNRVRLTADLGTERNGSISGWQ